jgi:hypothetical protein
MTADISSVGTQCFISYTRPDNEQFSGIVDRLKRDLAGRFEATTGRPLRIFLDRETIGWGEDWRSKIRTSIESATFLIPVITMRYFQSPACREELMAFYENAKQLGVTELVLPVILAGASQISADDPREEVRIIERVNYRNIEETWLDGYDSPAWMRMIHDMVQDLDRALQKAESAIAAREETALTNQAKKSVTTSQSGPTDADDIDIFELGEKFQEITALTEEASQALTNFGKASSDALSGDMSSLSRPQQQARMVKAAHDIKKHAEHLSDVGGRFEQSVIELDPQLRALVGELREINLDEAATQLQNLLEPMSKFEDMTESLGQMDQMVQMLRFASLTNVSLRKAIQPAIKGIQSMGNAVRTAESWRDI